MFTIHKDFEFSASHQLQGLPDSHPCSRVHGHNYVVRFMFKGDLNEAGFVIDYRDLDVLKQYINGNFDHRHLNDVLASNPTAEHLAAHFFTYAMDIFGRQLYAVGVSETAKTWAEYRNG